MKASFAIPMRLIILGVIVPTRIKILQILGNIYTWMFLTPPLLTLHLGSFLLQMSIYSVVFARLMVIPFFTLDYYISEFPLCAAISALSSE